jgi:predicted molibdopterin-dependent oxidoreductase YjgC
MQNSRANSSFDDLKGASKIYLIGSEINMDNAVAGFIIHNNHFRLEIPLELITIHDDSALKNKVDRVIQIKSYYYFVKALNHYLISNKLENRLFINDNCIDFDEYKQTLLAEKFEELCINAGPSKQEIANFANDYNKQMNAIIVFSEKEVSSNTCFELFNLALITGKLGKTSNGLISLKEKNNSQGLFDMGMFSNMGVGGVDINNEALRKKIMETWDVDNIPTNITENQIQSINKGLYKNIFIFGEDPIGCAVDKNIVAKWFTNNKFMMVQDYFLTETAQKADLVIPALFPFEQGGSFTNTQKYYQKFDTHIDNNIEYSSYRQLIKLLNKFESNGLIDVEDVMMEILSLLPDEESDSYHFTYTNEDNSNRMFNFGCDALVKTFDEDFHQALNKK